MKKIFNANTGRKTIMIGLDVRLKHGLNSWSEEAVEKYLDKNTVEKYSIVFEEKPKEIIVEPKVDEEAIRVAKERARISEERKLLDFDLTPMKITKMDSTHLEKLLKQVRNVPRLIEIRESLNTFTGAAFYKRCLTKRINELKKEAEDKE